MSSSIDNLTGPNYLGWIRNFSITLYLENEISIDANEEEATKCERHRYHYIKVLCLMLAIMYYKLQKICKNLGAYQINENLNEISQVQA
uniref:Uncharacterized protein n=1 Tax=Lactuca sativa TaxID=4236 RepID=A0A9R1WAJ9_LACSA|nr:hypothetical protein LSAT_V11C300109280 [Lactuca sativa]